MPPNDRPYPHYNVTHSEYSYLSRDGDLNLDTSLDVDDDGFDNLSWGIKIDQSFVDLHLPEIPGLGTFTIGCLSGGDLEDLGWKADGALNAEVLGFSAIDEFGADLLDRLDVTAGECNADLVDFGSFAEILVFVVGHFEIYFRSRREILVT